jgi:hypothetical protein
VSKAQLRVPDYLEHIRDIKHSKGGCIEFE